MIYVPLGVIIYKYSQNIFLSYLIYFSFEFFFFNFSGIRQSLALSGILISYYFIINKKPWKFIILILLSASFHNTALVFLPAYWLAQKKITKSYLLCLLGFFIIMYIMKYRIGEILTNLYYDDSQHVIGLYESSTGIGGTAVFIILVLLLGFIFYNASTFSAIIENRVLTNIMIIALMIQLLSSFSYLFTRLNLYYFIFIILYLPYVVSKIGRGNIKMKIKEAFLVKGVISIIFIFFFASFYISKVFQGLDRILPYKFFWN
ncbi:EpsG family protein [Bacillus timonensis]|uniref:EpsG family protein n=1 Tax=Bacillus timonensis TaxID=1033734 RepID=A0A4V3V882_9BACI|nr:EpsG family protein [Bacillus timonensis]THE14033.1 EpsG family protein [Bacillus timonensis]